METFTMSGRERKRLEVLSRVKRGEVRLVRAAEVLELSYRQSKRVYQRYCQAGDRGLVHGLRGRPGDVSAGLARRRVVVCEELDGTIRLRYRGRPHRVSCGPPLD